MLNLCYSDENNEVSGFLAGSTFSIIAEKFEFEPVFFQRPATMINSKTKRFEIPSSIAYLREGQCDLALGSFGYYWESFQDIEPVWFVHQVEVFWTSMPPKLKPPFFNILKASQILYYLNS